MSTAINSYSFFLNTSSNNYTNGSSWNIPLPTNISVSNPANSFSAFITEASIPQTPFIISDQIGNNVFEFKLQVYVDKYIDNLTNETTVIDKWMDCTDVQRQYIDKKNTNIGGLNIEAFAVSSTNLNPINYNGPRNWCDFEANKVVVPNGNYTTNASLVNAVQDALANTLVTLNSRMNFLGHYWSLGGNSCNFTNSVTLNGTDKTDIAIKMTNLWSVQTNSFPQLYQILFKRYRLYIKSNEILSMLGFTDRDITFDFADCIPNQFQIGGYPDYNAELNTVTYTSPNIINLDPNVNYYIACLNLSQTKSFVAINGNAVTSQTFSSIFRSQPPIARSEIYYSLPTIIQIQDKNFNFIEFSIKDYRNRTIPTVLFTSPIYLTIVFQEVLGAQSTPAINLQQLDDIDAVFWRQKELELQFELESFIRSKR